MIYSRPIKPGEETVVLTHRFLDAVRVRVRKPDGSMELRGYGIGETIRVIHPQSIFSLVFRPERLDEVPLEDGSVIFEYPETARTEVYLKGVQCDR
jgi:hypothetical protein